MAWWQATERSLTAQHSVQFFAKPCPMVSRQWLHYRLRRQAHQLPRQHKTEKAVLNATDDRIRSLNDPDSPASEAKNKAGCASTSWVGAVQNFHESMRPALATNHANQNWVLPLTTGFIGAHSAKSNAVLDGIKSRTVSSPRENGNTPTGPHSGQATSAGFS